MLCSSYSFRESKFLLYKGFTKTSSYGDWEVTLKIYFVNAKYWLTIIELESLLFIFIKNFRLTHFSFFVTGLKEIIMYMFLYKITYSTHDEVRYFSNIS